MSFKKKLYWKTTFGKIEVREQTFLSLSNKIRIRPFSLSAGVQCRGYSMRLQRVLTDFGADQSFGDATKKMREHYGIEIPTSTTRLKVEEHAEKMKFLNESNIFKSGAQKTAQVIGEADGGMVPLVATQKAMEGAGAKIDRRKNKKLFWKEGLLCFARGHKTVNPYFYASMGSREEVGKQLAKCSDLAGRYKETRLHCLGDGATWIAEQVESQFGSDANFLIDFYHLTQYLAAAAQCIQADDPIKWLDAQKKLILEGNINNVFQALQEHINTKGQEHEECPAQKCFNYMDKRRKYLNYKEALDAELPIGSGEIESGIRAVIQSRLKLPGAWWLAENADAMLALKTVRVNGFWEQYWGYQKDVHQEFSAHA
jgi:hypothetical protein